MSRPVATPFGERVALARWLLLGSWNGQAITRTLLANDDDVARYSADAARLSCASVYPRKANLGWLAGCVGCVGVSRVEVRDGRRYKRGKGVAGWQAGCATYQPPISLSGLYCQGGYNSTGAPERFHYTASRGIISSDISAGRPRGLEIPYQRPSAVSASPLNPLRPSSRRPATPSRNDGGNCRVLEGAGWIAENGRSSLFDRSSSQFLIRDFFFSRPVFSSF